LYVFFRRSFNIINSSLDSASSFSSFLTLALSGLDAFLLAESTQLYMFLLDMLCFLATDAMLPTSLASLTICAFPELRYLLHCFLNSLNILRLQD